MAQDFTGYAGKAGIADVADTDPVVMFILIGFIGAMRKHERYDWPSIPPSPLGTMNPEVSFPGNDKLDGSCHPLRCSLSNLKV